MKKKKEDILMIPWDEWMARYLKDEKTAIAYLNVVLEEFQEDGEIEPLMLALRRVAETQGGLGKLAKKTDLNRENLYKALSARGNPRFDTFTRLLNALGFHITVTRTKQTPQAKSIKRSIKGKRKSSSRVISKSKEKKSA